MAKTKKASTTAQLGSLETVFKKHSTAFSRGLEILGRTTFIFYKIDTGEGPIRKGMQRISHEQIPVLKGEIKKLQKARAIEPSISLFAGSVIFVRKKDKMMRV